MTTSTFNNNQKAAFCEGQKLLMKQLGCTIEEATTILLNTLQSMADDLN
jgi:hypothetical protein